MTSFTLATHVAFAFALFGVSLALTWLMMRVVRVMDVPNERSSHAKPVPKSGGVGIVIAFLIGLLIVYAIADVARLPDRLFWGFLGSAVLLSIVAFIDDITQRSFIVKVLSQFIAVFTVMWAGIVIQRMSIPFFGQVEMGSAGYVVTFLWIVGLTNAYNFMDGLDGLAGGVATIAAAFVCMLAFNAASFFVYITSYVLIASVAGFTVFNFPPARIFMGDVGSTFIGFAFATLAVIGANLDFGHLPLYVVPLLLFHFIFDTSFTFARRVFAGEKVHLAHRTHLYQLLNRLGYSHRAVTLYHYGITVANGVGAWILVGVAPADRPLVFLPFLIYQSVYAWWVVSWARERGLISTSRATHRN